MKTKIRDYISRLENRVAYLLYCICGRFTPLKGLIFVLIVGGAMMSASIYFVVDAIYNMGKRDAKIGLSRMQDFDNQYFDYAQQPNQENINILNFEEYEYE
jgi:hypothetical protein